MTLSKGNFLSETFLNFAVFSDVKKTNGVPSSLPSSTGEAVVEHWKLHIKHINQKFKWALDWALGSLVYLLQFLLFPFFFALVSFSVSVNLVFLLKSSHGEMKYLSASIGSLTILFSYLNRVLLLPTYWILIKALKSECGKIRTRKTPNTDTFHALL